VIAKVFADDRRCTLYVVMVVVMVMVMMMMIMMVMDELGRV
jgi:hypothetical protein